MNEIMSDAVLCDVQGGVARVTLNRPATRHALSSEILRAGAAVLDRLAADESVRCVVLTGGGDKAFCAGADLKERITLDAQQMAAYRLDLRGFCDRLAGFAQPVLAAINGAAFGGGLEIALCCDLRIAVDDAMLGLPEVKLGIIPGAGGTQRLARVCGVGVAKSLIMTGRRIDAREALRLGIVSAVVPRAELPAEIGRWTREILEAGPLAVAQAKRAIDGGWGKPMDDALAVEWGCYDVVLRSADRDEGLRAFAEKRPPKFSGK